MKFKHKLLRKLREQKIGAQGDLVVALIQRGFKVYQTNIHAWETGKSVPKYEALKHLSAVLGVEVDDFFCPETKVKSLTND